MDSALIRELMVVNDISSSDNDVIGDDDSDIVLDDIVIKKVRNLFVLVLRKSRHFTHCSNINHHHHDQVAESSSDQPLSSMVAHCLPLLPSNPADVRTKVIVAVFSCICFLYILS